ncbi:unnamed protein product, partial [Phaeothamnion confervicola]
ARVVVGPVIGRVSRTTAAILVEVDQPADVTVVVTDVLGLQRHKAALKLQRRHPRAFLFGNLRPGLRYTV